jgi:hypothetical protein
VPAKAGQEGGSFLAEEVNDEEARRRAEEDAEVEMEMRRAMFVAEMKRIQMEQEREGVLAQARVEDSVFQEMKMPADSEAVEREEDTQEEVVRRPVQEEERTMDSTFGAEVLRAEDKGLPGKEMGGMQGNEQDTSREMEQQEREHNVAVAVATAADEKRQMEATATEISLHRKEEQRLKRQAEEGGKAREERDGEIVLCCAQTRHAMQIQSANLGVLCQ